jgi:hypothetical protein
VSIHSAKIDTHHFDNSDQGDGFCFAADEALLFWEQIGTFLVRKGREIIIDPNPGVEENLVRLPLLGAVLAVLLHQRGQLVLHASAVDIGGQAVAFIGAKGKGKSTMAAALYGRGHKLIGDDMVVVSLDEQGQPFLLPGFPQFKLWPAAAAVSLGDNPELLPRLISAEEKRVRRIRDRFSEDKTPLRGIYTLCGGAEPAIKSLQSKDAILQLFTHSYVARFGQACLKGEVAVTHLKQCVELINRVPVFRLERPASLDLLAETAQMLENQTLAVNSHNSEPSVLATSSTQCKVEIEGAH